MAKLYNMLINTRSQINDTIFDQYKSSSTTSLDSSNHLYDTNFGGMKTEYHLAEETHTGFICEPCPNEDQSDSKKYQMIRIQALLDQATTLCNDLDELIALHYSFYEAVENVFGRDRRYIAKDRKELSSKDGLSLFPSWLRERDFTVLDAMHALQQSLRRVYQEIKEQ